MELTSASRKCKTYGQQFHRGSTCLNRRHAIIEKSCLKTPWSFRKLSDFSRFLFLCVIFAKILETESKQGFFGDPGTLTDVGIDLNAYDGLLNLEESEVTHRRSKRFLSFPPSSIAMLKTKLTVPLFDKYDSYVVGTFKGYTTVSYTLPTNFVTIGKSLKASGSDVDGSLLRAERSSVAEGRLQAYAAIESAFESLGMRGRTCLLKAVCEVADEGLPESYGLLGEVTAMLLASSHNVDNSTRSALAQYSEAEHRGRHAGNCNTQYTGCPFHLRDLIHYAVTVLHGDSRRGTWH